MRADQCGWELLCIGSAPVAYLPVRRVAGSRVTGGLFCHFYFLFSTMLPKQLSKHVLTCIDISGTERT